MSRKPDTIMNTVLMTDSASRPPPRNTCSHGRASSGRRDDASPGDGSCRHCSAHGYAGATG
jgi:hypothetical protein